MPLLPIDVTLPGSGRVARPFPFLFNFPLEEGLEFRTDVIITDDGSEQRIATRDTAHPRRILRATLVAIEPRERLQLEAMLFGWGGKPFVVPCWQDAMTLLNAAEPTDTSLEVVDAEGRELAERVAMATEVPMLLWRSHERYELVLLESITDETLGLVDAVAGDWPAGTRLVPCRFMFLPAEVEIDRLTARGGVVELEFIEQSEMLVP